jgi:hypothetical protein
MRLGVGIETLAEYPDIGGYGGCTVEEKGGKLKGLTSRIVQSPT